MVLLDLLFKVTIYANFSLKWLWSNNFLRFQVLSNNLCKFNLKKWIWSNDYFRFKKNDFAYFGFKVDAK